MTTTLSYRQPSAAPASARTEPALDFDGRLATFARGLRLSVNDLTEQESELLTDYGRGASRDGEVRYRLRTFKALIGIARRSSRPEQREALAEIIRAELLADVASPSIATAFDAETPAPGQADVRQREFERNPNPTTWAACRDALMHQLAVTRRALDAVIAWPFARSRT